MYFVFLTYSVVFYCLCSLFVLFVDCSVSLHKLLTSSQVSNANSSELLGSSVLVLAFQDILSIRPIIQTGHEFNDEVNMNTMPKTVSKTVSKTRKNVLRYGFLLYVNVDQNTANTNTTTTTTNTTSSGNSSSSLRSKTDYGSRINLTNVDREETLSTIFLHMNGRTCVELFVPIEETFRSLILLFRDLHRKGSLTQPLLPVSLCETTHVVTPPPPPKINISLTPPQSPQSPAMTPAMTPMLTPLVVVEEAKETFIRENESEETTTVPLVVRPSNTPPSTPPTSDTEENNNMSSSSISNDVDEDDEDENTSKTSSDTIQVDSLDSLHSLHSLSSSSTDIEHDAVDGGCVLVREWRE